MEGDGLGSLTHSLENQSGISPVQIRQNPHLPARSVILIPQVLTNLKESQERTDGMPIKDKYGFPLVYSNNGNSVHVISPDDHLFILEEQPDIRGFGVYDRDTGFGVDERLHAEGSFSPTSLELLIKAFIERTTELKKSEKGNLLRQFLAYGTYRIDKSSVDGRLLVSKAIAPNIENELKEAARYFQLNGRDRCLYCDIAEQEKSGALQTESRVILYHDAPVYGKVRGKDNTLLYNNGAIAFVPFAPIDQHNVHIFPLKHTSRLIDLSDEQIRNLSDLVYKCLIGISADAKAVGREIHNLEFVLHSMPFYAKNDAHLMRNGDNEVESYSHSYIDI